jgi:monoamine oxidase
MDEPAILGLNFKGDGQNGSYIVKSKPISYHVARWSNKPYSQGAWSQLLVGGTPDDREQLGRPISDAFILAGEATARDFPSQVHGAYISGKRAAKWCLDSINSVASTRPLFVVVIGAGATGISAAETIHNALIQDDKNSEHKIIVIEALDHIGGRSTTISMDNGIQVDSGGTWMQQYKSNPMVQEALRMGLHLIPTDFMSPLAACADGAVSVDEINDMVLQIETAAQLYHEAVCEDSSIMQIIKTIVFPKYKDNPRMIKVLELTIAEIMADTGIDLNTLSSKYGLEEPSYVGEGDHYIREGFSSILAGMSTGIDIRYNTPVKIIDWGGKLGAGEESDSRSIKITTSTNEIFDADYCICTVPISILQEPDTNPNKILTIRPPLPNAHMSALSHMKMAICDKVILQFDRRWWPSSASSNNILKWYGDGKYGNSFTDMLDATDGLGVPIVVFYMIGEDNVKRLLDGKSDSEIATLAYEELVKWSEAIVIDKNR